MLRPIFEEVLEVKRCIGLQWPPDSGGHRPLWPRLKHLVINKLIIKFDDWTFERRPVIWDFYNISISGCKYAK